MDQTPAQPLSSKVSVESHPQLIRFTETLVACVLDPVNSVSLETSELCYGIKHNEKSATRYPSDEERYKYSVRHSWWQGVQYRHAYNSIELRKRILSHQGQPKAEKRKTL